MLVHIFFDVLIEFRVSDYELDTMMRENELFRSVRCRMVRFLKGVFNICNSVRFVGCKIMEQKRLGQEKSRHKQPEKNGNCEFVATPYSSIDC